MAIENGSRDTFGRITELPISPIQYYELLRQINILLQDQLALRFEKALSGIKLDDVLVTIPGSDARLEKGNFVSLMELIAYSSKPAKIAKLKRLLEEKIKDEFADRVESVIEVKDPTLPLSYYNGDPSKVHPDRVTASKVLSGKQADLVKYKSQIGEEFISLPRNKIVDRVEDHLRSATKTAVSGVNKIGGSERIHFDSDHLYFNPKEGTQATKAQLRVVQRKLLLEIIRYVRDSKDVALVPQLASGISNLLQQLHEAKMLDIPRSDLEELVEHYAFFLREYHRSEQAYAHGTSSRSITPMEVQDIERRTQAILGIVKHIKLKIAPRTTT